MTMLRCGNANRLAVEKPHVQHIADSLFTTAEAQAHTPNTADSPYTDPAHSPQPTASPKPTAHSQQPIVHSHTTELTAHFQCLLPMAQRITPVTFFVLNIRSSLRVLGVGVIAQTLTRALAFAAAIRSTERRMTSNEVTEMAISHWLMENS